MSTRFNQLFKHTLTLLLVLAVCQTGCNTKEQRCACSQQPEKQTPNKASEPEPIEDELQRAEQKLDVMRRRVIESDEAIKIFLKTTP